MDNLEKTHHNQTSSTKSSAVNRSQEISGANEQKADRAEPQDRVEQVREILFGAQREEYDRRFGELEELLVKNTSDLSNEITRKVGALRNDYDKRLARLEELLINNISDLGNDTAKKIEALSNDLSQTRSEKIDKTALTALLEQILKLSRELNIGMANDTGDEK